MVSNININVKCDRLCLVHVFKSMHVNFNRTHKNRTIIPTTVNVKAIVLDAAVMGTNCRFSLMKNAFAKHGNSASKKQKCIWKRAWWWSICIDLWKASHQSTWNNLLHCIWNALRTNLSSSFIGWITKKSHVDGLVIAIFWYSGWLNCVFEMSPTVMRLMAMDYSIRQYHEVLWLSNFIGPEFDFIYEFEISFTNLIELTNYDSDIKFG